MAKGKHGYEAHLFICTNSREKGACCKARGAEELRDRVKAYCKKERPDWSKRVRVNASGCLGYCEEGIAAVLYPEGHWFTELTPKSAPLLEEALRKILDR